MLKSYVLAITPPNEFFSSHLIGAKPNIYLTQGQYGQYYAVRSKIDQVSAVASGCGQITMQLSDIVIEDHNGEFVVFAVINNSSPEVINTLRQSFSSAHSNCLKKAILENKNQEIRVFLRSFNTKESALDYIAALKANWSPYPFTVSEISIKSREHTRGIWLTDAVIPLGPSA